MILAQTPLDWAELLQHSALVAFALAAGGTGFWLLKREYGAGGNRDKLMASRIACDGKNSETMAGNRTTLVQLKDLAANQQQLCGRHAVALEIVGTELVGVEGKLDKAVDATAAMANQWGNKNHKEYQTVPVLDAMLHTIDAAEALAAKCGCECGEELRALRGKIADEKTQMQRG